MGKGGFMDQQVRPAGKLHGRIAEHGVGAIDDAHTGPFFTTEAGAVDAATVRKAHRFTSLQLGVDRPGRDVQFPCFLNVEATSQGLLFDAIGVGRHTVGERGAAHREVVVLEQQRALLGCIPDPVDGEGIADAGGACTQHTVEVALQRVRPVEIHP